MTVPADDPVAVLERWRGSGADYRVVHLSESAAVVELCTCLGDAVERIESRDPRLLEYLALAGHHDDAEDDASQH